ncbi:MAG: ribosome silencing factor [Victivallaceae bacterium]
METNLLGCLKTIGSAIENKKGFNTVVLDVRSICRMTDFFIFTEGNVGVHVKAITESIIQNLKQEQLIPLCVEGMSIGEWVVIDYGFVIIHVFIPSVRDKYRVEELWKDGLVVKWNSYNSL